MEKFYLINRDVCETVYFNSGDEAFTEAQKRNKNDLLANWKAYDRTGEVIYGLAICR